MYKYKNAEMLNKIVQFSMLLERLGRQSIKASLKTAKNYIRVTPSGNCIGLLMFLVSCLLTTVSFYYKILLLVFFNLE